MMINKNRIIMFVIFLSSFMVFVGRVFADDADRSYGGGFNFSTFSLIRFLGICALVCASGSFVSAIFRKKLSGHFLKIHRVFGWLTIIFALSHGISMMILF